MISKWLVFALFNSVSALLALPQIYDVDPNWEKCREDGQYYCQVFMILQNKSENNEIWQQIQVLSNIIAFI